LWLLWLSLSRCDSSCSMRSSKFSIAVTIALNKSTTASGSRFQSVSSYSRVMRFIFTHRRCEEKL
jgi:hypothetical protein